MNIADWMPRLRGSFPRISTANSRLTSPVDRRYNCIAWAADDATRWWWPDPQSQQYWPEAVPRLLGMSAFEAAFRVLGYQEHADAAVEAGVQKVAIYALQGVPTHASRQLPDGWWASKLGQGIDVEHAFDALDGPIYGVPALVLARRPQK